MTQWANVTAMLNSMVRDGVFHVTENRAPVSGAAGSDGYGYADVGSLFFNNANGVLYVNEGSPQGTYWTPINYNQHGLLSWHSDFRDGVGIVNSDTAALYTIPGSGIKIFGSGKNETDSGFVVAIAEDGAIGTLAASATSGKTAAMGVGLTTSVPFQPDAHGPIVVDITWAGVGALTARSYFLGFIGTAADALAAPVTGATVTITLVQDDVAGMLMDSALTDATGIFLPHNKSDEAANILTTATGVDTGVDVEAFGTYQRWRCEILADGTMKAYKNKVLIGTITAALDVDEETTPAFVVTALASAVKSAVIKRFATWGYRNGVI